VYSDLLILVGYMPSVMTLNFVTEFRYLGHIINNLPSDDNDILRDIRNMYIRTNTSFKLLFSYKENSVIQNILCKFVWISAVTTYSEHPCVALDLN